MKSTKILVGGLTVIGAALSTATAFAANEGMIQLENKCLAIAGGIDKPGQAVVLFECNGTSNSQWLFEPDGRIRSALDTNLCLDVTGGSSANQTKIEVWSCNNPQTSNQTWTLWPDGTLRPFSGLKCLDDPGGNNADGTQVQIYDCHSPLSTNQSASFTGTKPTALSNPGEISVDGKCLNVARDAMAAGTAVVTWPCDGESDEQWVVETDGTIRPAQDTNLCLDVVGGNLNPPVGTGTPLDIWSCNGGTNQIWSFDYDGTLRTIAGQCLDLPFGSGSPPNDGTQWQIFSCHSPTQVNQNVSYTGFQPTVSATASVVIGGVNVCLSGSSFAPGSTTQVEISGLPGQGSFERQAFVSSSGTMSLTLDDFGNIQNQCSPNQQTSQVLIQVIDNEGNWSETTLPGCLWCATGSGGCGSIGSCN